MATFVFLMFVATFALLVLVFAHAPFLGLKRWIVISVILFVVSIGLLAEFSYMHEATQAIDKFELVDYLSKQDNLVISGYAEILEYNEHLTKGRKSITMRGKLEGYELIELPNTKQE